MIQQRWLKTSNQLVVVLLVSLSTVGALEDFYQLCPKGNITIISANTRSTIVTPDKCYPIPVVNRNLLSSKPVLQIVTEQSHLFSYTAVMVEFNSTLNKYELYWMEPNLTVNFQRFLVQNTTIIRDIRKMIEYRPPKASAQNVTYFIFVFRQSTMPVQPPSGSGPFILRSWAITSRLTLVGGAQFKVLGNMPFTHQPAHHQPLPSPAVIPGSQHYPQPGVNAVQNYSFAGNYTNHTYPLPPYYPPPPSPGHYYPPAPAPPSPYNPPAYHPPNQFYPPSNVPPKKNKKGAAVELQAGTSLIILMALLSFVFNV